MRYYRPDRCREVAVWLGGRLLDWILTRERGRPADAERRITKLAYVYLVEPGAGDGA